MQDDQYKDRMQRILAACLMPIWSKAFVGLLLRTMHNMLIDAAVRSTGYERIAVHILQLSVSVYSGVVLAAARP